MRRTERERRLIWKACFATGLFAIIMGTVIVLCLKALAEPLLFALVAVQ